MPLLMRARMSMKSPRGLYTSMTKHSSSPESKLSTPWGNSVNRKSTTTANSIRVVRLVLRSLAEGSGFGLLPEELLPRAADAGALFWRKFCLRASACFIVCTRRMLRMVRPMQGTNFTSIAWIQKFKSWINFSFGVSTLKLTYQRTAEELLLGSFVFSPWTVMVTKLGIHTIRVTTYTKKTATLARNSEQRTAPRRGYLMKMYLKTARVTVNHIETVCTTTLKQA